MKNFCLFNGRHDLPNNPSAIFDSFDFEGFKAIESEFYQEFLDSVSGGDRVNLYVTGLTPALTQVLAVCGRARNLYLMHYNTSTSSYVERCFAG